MTQNPGPSSAPAPETTGMDRFFDWLRSIDLRRDSEDKWLAGVCSGVAKRLGVDPIVIRAVLVLLVIMGGLGVTLYLVAWGFVANDREEIVAERAIRHGDVLGIILLVVIGLTVVGGSGLANDGPGFLWFWWLLLPIGVVVWLVMRDRDRRPARQHPGGSAQAASWTTPTSSTPTPPWAPGQEPTMTYAAPPPTMEGAPAGGPAVGAGHPGGPAAGQAPPHAPVPPAPPAPKPPRAPRPPRRRSAGFVGAVLVGGLALAAYGLTLWLHEQGSWGGSDETVALAVALAVCGVALVGFGIAGLRAGFTGFVAVVLAITTWTAAVVPDLNLGGGVGDRLWRPTATDTSKDFRIGIGSAELDLSALPNDPATPAEIKAGVGIGELKIRIPEELTVRVRSQVGVGDVSRVRDAPLFGDDRDVFERGSNGRSGSDISTDETFGSGDPDVVVDARVGIGQITIGKE